MEIFINRQFLQVLCKKTGYMCRNAMPTQQLQKIYIKIKKWKV